MKIGARIVTVLLPEYRQIELYSKKKSLAVAEDPAADLAVALDTARGLSDAFRALDAHLGGPSSESDPMESWAKYRGLPRRSAFERLGAEIFRTLRIVHTAVTHPTGRVEIRNGLIKASATVENTALTLRITRIGADLLGSVAAYRRMADALPYSEAYVEAMMLRYWADIADEIRWYYDEDRVLFQFRDPLGLDRHARFDCDNPRITVEAEALRFDFGPAGGAGARRPIDFFVVHDGRLHIVPSEALTDRALPLAELPRWRARLPDGLTLPACFRQRFTREVMVQGLPMT